MLLGVRPSAASKFLEQYTEWTETYGAGQSTIEQDHITSQSEISHSSTSRSRSHVQSQSRLRPRSTTPVNHDPIHDETDP